MARKETLSNAWIASDKVGTVTLFKTRRSPYWWMYWTQRHNGANESVPPYGCTKSTRETDLSLARVIAAKTNEDLFTRSRYPELAPTIVRPRRLRGVVSDFVAYLTELGRSYDHIKNVRGRLGYLERWADSRGHPYLHDVTPKLIQIFIDHLKNDRELSPKTINHYIGAMHSFFGFVIHKKQLMPGPNPAATGRQAQLDRMPLRSVPPPTIYPDQVNAIIEAANRHDDRQVVHLIVFICEGGFRIQELQFLQVGDIRLEEREIVLDVKRPDLKRVRPELRRRCLTPDGYWLLKSRASRRVIHITDRMARLIKTMGQGDPSDWVFLNRAGNQVAANKTRERLKRYGLEARVLIAENPTTGQPWSLIKWHWLRHYHRTRAHVSKIRRDVSKIAMGHAADPIRAIHCDILQFRARVLATLA